MHSLSLTLLLLFLIPTQDSDWKLEKNKNGIKVYTRKLEDFPIKEFRVEANTAAPLESIESLFRDIENYSSWMPDIREVSLIEQVSPDIYIYHMIIAAPFPISDRDLITEMRITYPTEEILRIDYDVLPDHIPEKDDHVRMRYFTGHWQFIRADSATNITNQFLSDPGGSVPKWLANSFIARNPFETVTKLKEKIE